MQKDINELSEAWKRAIDSDLLKAATENWGEYSHDAQAIIEIEARKRGLWEKVLALRGEKTYEPISAEDSVSNTKEKEKSILGIVKWGGIAILFVLSRFVGSISITVLFFALLFAFIIGGWLARWYFKRRKVSQALIKVIVWSNVLTWIVPYLGMLTGSATLEFSNLVEQEKKKYKILAIIGIGLALLSALANIIIYYLQMKSK